MKLFSLFTLIFVLTACGNNSPLIVTIGDSTVANQPLERGPQGWGFHLQSPNFKNLARSGRSSKTFYENFWSGVKKESPDILLVQFGLNDSKPDDRYTDPKTTFKDYLQKYIDEGRALGAEVIFVTSPNRLVGPDVKVYVDSMVEVANENGVHVIDLYQYSLELQKNYEEDIEKIYFDETHPNFFGSKAYSKFIDKNLKNHYY